MTVIKFCGMRTNADVEAALSFAPDYMGFIISQGFKRSVAPRDAAALIAHARSISPKPPLITGVFVNEDPEDIVAFTQKVRPDAIQLHGEENENYIHTLRSSIPEGIRIIKVFKMEPGISTDAMELSPADLILLDAGTGEGKTFPWELAGQIRRPYLLAGGLNAENVREAIRLLHPYGVDVSSGIESDHKKDIIKMTAFTDAVRKEEL